MILPPELFELPRIAQELAEANRAERECVARLEAEQHATRQEVRDGFAQTSRQLSRLDTRVGAIEGRLERVETDLAGFRQETSERFSQVDKRFDEVGESFCQVDKRFDQMDERFDHVDARLAQMDERFDHVDEQFARVDSQFLQVGTRLQRMGTDIGSLKGVDMEERLRARVPRFRHVVPQPVALTPVEIATWLDGEVAAGRLTHGEARQIERADLIVRSGEPGVSSYLVIEVSWLVDERNVRRAHQRAALLRKANDDVRAAVAGSHIEAETVALAERLGVLRMIDDEIDAALDAATEAGAADVP